MPLCWLFYQICEQFLLSQRPQTFSPTCSFSERGRISFYQKRREALFDWLSGRTPLSQYWSAVPKGMWHHYEAWPYHLQPSSVRAGPGQNLMSPAPKVGAWRVTGRLVRVLFVFLTSRRKRTPQVWNQHPAWGGRLSRTRVIFSLLHLHAEIPTLVPVQDLVQTTKTLVDLKYFLSFDNNNPQPSLFTIKKPMKTRNSTSH